MCWCYLLNFDEVPQGREIKLWPFWILPHGRSPSCKDLRPWVAARSCTTNGLLQCQNVQKSFHLVYSLGAEGIIREFLAPWRKSGVTGKQRFCITSPETLSVIAQVNQPNASISDVTLGYSSSSLNFLVPIHFCVLYYTTLWELPQVLNPLDW